MLCKNILVRRCRKDRRSQGGPLPYCSSAVAHTQTRFGTNGTALASLHQHQSPGRRAASPIRSARPLKRRQQPVFGEGARHRSCAAELADRCCRQSGSTDRSRILAGTRIRTSPIRANPILWLIDFSSCQFLSKRHSYGLEKPWVNPPKAERAKP